MELHTIIAVEKHSIDPPPEEETHVLFRSDFSLFFFLFFPDLKSEHVLLTLSNVDIDFCCCCAAVSASLKSVTAAYGEFAHD